MAAAAGSGGYGGSGPPFSQFGVKPSGHAPLKGSLRFEDVKGSRLLSFPPFILCVLAIHPLIHRAKVVLCRRRGRCKAEMVSRRPRRPRRTFRCGDENNYALSSLSSSMCAKRCSLGSTWPGKGSLVTSVAGVAAAAAARPSARSHGAGGRAPEPTR